MSGQLTLWGAGQILNSFFGRGESPPEYYHLSLINAVAPTPYVNGNELDEPSVGAYARAAVPNDVVNWGTSGTLNISSNLDVITFAVATADWGTLRYWALCNTLTGGSPYIVGKLTNPIQILDGDIAQVSTGEITVELGPFSAAWES